MGRRIVGCRLRVLVWAAIAIALLPGVGAGAQASDSESSYTSAVLNFEIPADAPSAVLHFFCWPPTGGQPGVPANGTLTVASDGRIDGSCTVDEEQDGGDGSSVLLVRSSSLSGTYDTAAQRAQFHMEGTATTTHTPPASCARCETSVVDYTIVLDAPSTNVVDDHARGVADYTYTCQPAAGCNAAFPAEATATFDLAFAPPLAGGSGEAAPVETSAPTTSSSGGSSTNPFLILLVLAGVSAALIAAWRLLFANRGRKAAAAARAAGDGRTSPPVQGAVGSDRSGGNEDTLSYGVGAGSAAPAASKAYEGLVVAQSQGPSAEDPLAKDPEKPALVDEREWEKETGSDSEGR
jgi:hypothetical protein